MNEQEFATLADGQIAGALLDKLRPILVKQQQAIFGRLKGLYRGGAIEHTVLVSQIAQAVALEDLENALRAQSTAAERIRQKETEV